MATTTRGASAAAVRRDGRGGPKRSGGAGWFTALLVLIGAGALATGAIGWVIQGETTPGGFAWVDIAVRSLHSLFLSGIYFDDGIKTEALPWLHASRTLGAVFTVLVAARIILFALGTRLTEWTLSRRSGHDLVIGEGAAAVDYALQAGQSGPREVTHLLSDEPTHGGRSAQLNRSGSLLQQFQKAGARRAKRIIVDEADDADTWETAQRAARECPDVDVLAHIRDTWVLERLSRADPEASLRAFSYAGGVARQILLAHPPYLLSRAMGAPKQHILLIGFGSVGQAILREFLITSVSANPADMMITAIDPRMDVLEADFLARHPGLNAQVSVELLKGDLRQDGEALLAKLKARREASEICSVYVSIDDAHLPLSAGLAIRDRAARLDLFRAPIFLCADHGAGLPPVRQGVGLVGAAIADPKEVQKREEQARMEGVLCDLRLVSFGSWADAFDGSGLGEPELDGQARRLHETYERLVNATNDSQGVSSNPWKNLSDEFRASNRRAAAHIRAKVDAAGYDLNAWLAEPPYGRRAHELPPAREAFQLNNAGFMERLGELEHRRWMIDRLLNGWQYGEKRDNRARLHPDLRPYRELGDKAKGKDDNVIATTAELIDSANGRKRKG